MERLLQEFLKQMETLSLKHEAPWVLEEMRRLNLPPAEQGPYLAQVVERRRSGEPLAYIFGHWSFLHMELDVGVGVLIPRPETEELVEVVFERIRARSKNFSKLHVVDAGAGSGCLGLGLFQELHRSSDFQNIPVALTLIEQSSDALPYLKKNAQLYAKDAEVFEGSWNAWIPQGSVQVLLSNPPYISGHASDEAEADVKNYEPHEALYPADLERFSDASGPYRELLNLAQMIVAKDGYAAFELGPSQAPWIASFVEENYPEWRGDLLKDMSGKERFWIMERIR